MRYPGPDLDLDDLFLFEAKRRVMKDRTLAADAFTEVLRELGVAGRRVDPHANPTV